jgi:hypothetical protein
MPFPVRPSGGFPNPTGLPVYHNEFTFRKFTGNSTIGPIDNSVIQQWFTTDFSTLVEDLTTPGTERNLYFESLLDNVNDIFLNIQVDFPNVGIIYRPFRDLRDETSRGILFHHLISDADYVTLHRFVISYLRRKGVHNMLVSYNYHLSNSSVTYVEGNNGSNVYSIIDGSTPSSLERRVEYNRFTKENEDALFGRFPGKGFVDVMEASIYHSHRMSPELAVFAGKIEHLVGVCNDINLVPAMELGWQFQDLGDIDISANVYTLALQSENFWKNNFDFLLNRPLARKLSYIVIPSNDHIPLGRRQNTVEYSNSNAKVSYKIIDNQEVGRIFNGDIRGTAQRNVAAKYIELTPAVNNRYGFVLWKMKMGIEWSITFEHFAGGGTGSDGTYVQLYRTTTPTATTGGYFGNSYDQIGDGLTIFIDENSGRIRFVTVDAINPNTILNVASPINSVFNIANSTWRKVNISLLQNADGTGNLTFSMPTLVSQTSLQIPLDYMDVYRSRTASSSNFIISGRCGGLNNIHRVRNISFSTNVSYIQPYEHDPDYVSFRDYLAKAPHDMIYLHNPRKYVDIRQTIRYDVFKVGNTLNDGGGVRPVGFHFCNDWLPPPSANVPFITISVDPNYIISGSANIVAFYLNDIRSTASKPVVFGKEYSPGIPVTVDMPPINMYIDGSVKSQGEYLFYRYGYSTGDSVPDLLPSVTYHPPVGTHGNFEFVILVSSASIASFDAVFNIELQYQAPA